MSKTSSLFVDIPLSANTRRGSRDTNRVEIGKCEFPTKQRTDEPTGVAYRVGDRDAYAS